MTDLVDVGVLRAQLRLAADATSEDDLLQQMLDAAHAAVAQFIERDLVDLGDDETAVAAQAIIIWATALYEDRVGSGATPRAVTALLRPLRSLAR